MLKKLYKHELYSLFRNLWPIYAALALFTVMCKITQLIEMDNVIYNIISNFSVMFYVISIFAMFIVGMVIIVMRFYKNLLSHEGYLTFSLPFTATQHIVCKLICSVVMNIINVIAIIISLFIIGFGTEVLKELFNTFKMMFNDFAASEGAFTVILFCFEIAVMAILSLLQSTLMFYAAMAIGQQFKSKVGASVVAYIALYSASQMVSTILCIPLLLGFGEELDLYLESSLTALNIFFLFPIVLSLVLAAAYFFITRYFLSKKLNLE